MKNYFPILSIILLLAFVSSCTLYDSRTISGTVFSFESNGDREGLPFVYVHLYISEDRGIHFDKQLSTKTNEDGIYDFQIKNIPYPSTYKITFDKGGFEPDSFIVNLDESKSFIYDQLLIINGDNSGNYIFERIPKFVDPKDGGYLFIAFLIVALAIAIIYKFNNLWIIVMDWFRHKKRIKFTDMNQASQDQITSKAFCPTCETEKGMVFESEEDIKGMTFLHGYCRECKSPIKMRMQ